MKSRGQDLYYNEIWGGGGYSTNVIASLYISQHIVICVPARELSSSLVSLLSSPVRQKYNRLDKQLAQNCATHHRDVPANHAVKYSYAVNHQLPSQAVLVHHHRRMEERSDRSHQECWQVLHWHLA